MHNWKLWESEDSLHVYTDESQEEPRTIQDALIPPVQDKWKAAIDSEYTSLIENEGCTLVELPQGRKPIGCRWVFKIKHHADGSIERYKARLVAKGYSQQAGVNFEETYSPVARYTTIRTVLAIANQLVAQMDVQTAFLNGELLEKIYMNQPEGFVENGKEHLVCKLKSLYGLKQASRCWFKTMDIFLKDNGYE